MSRVRKAHSVEIVDRRLRTAEASMAVDDMELVGLHDELTRVERKWREKAAGPPRANGRPPADAGAIDERFQRLGRLVAVARRRAGGDPAERAMLERIDVQLRARQPLADGLGEPPIML